MNLKADMTDPYASSAIKSNKLKSPKLTSNYGLDTHNLKIDTD